MRIVEGLAEFTGSRSWHFFAALVGRAGLEQSGQPVRCRYALLLIGDAMQAMNNGQKGRELWASTCGSFNKQQSE
jgi:hypothetical protein